LLNTGISEKNHVHFLCITVRGIKNEITNNILISTILILTLAMPISALQIIEAHTPLWNIPTWTYPTAIPDSVGVGRLKTMNGFFP